MVNPARKISIIVLFLLIAPVVMMAADTVRCAECGMTCDIAAQFTARIIHEDRMLYFCDVGDLFSYLHRKKPDVTRVEVKDYETGNWVDAHKAYYIHSEKKFTTPMGWGIAPFIDKNKAASYGSIIDYDVLINMMK